MSDHNPALDDWDNHELEELTMALHGIKERPVPEESLARSLAAAERIPMTAAAWRRGFLNMLLLGMPVTLMGTAATWWLASRFGLSWRSALSLWAMATLLIGFPLMLLARFRQRNLVGTVLIDCGPAPGRRLLLVEAFSLPIVAILQLATDGLKPDTATRGVGFCCIALFFGYMAGHRLQLCEGGIRLYQFLPWSKIKSYSWKEGAAPTLLVQTTFRFAWYGRAAYPIPAEHRPAVEDLLRRKVGAERPQTAS